MSAEYPEYILDTTKAGSLNLLFPYSFLFKIYSYIGNFLVNELKNYPINPRMPTVADPSKLSYKIVNSNWVINTDASFLELLLDFITKLQSVSLSPYCLSILYIYTIHLYIVNIYVILITEQSVYYLYCIKNYIDHPYAEIFRKLPEFLSDFIFHTISLDQHTLPVCKSFLSLLLIGMPLFYINWDELYDFVRDFIDSFRNNEPFYIDLLIQLLTHLTQSNSYIYTFLSNEISESGEYQFIRFCLLILGEIFLMFDNCIYNDQILPQSLFNCIEKYFHFHLSLFFSVITNTV